jgi:small subunit ribosomal protein S6
MERSALSPRTDAGLHNRQFFAILIAWESFFCPTIVHAAQRARTERGISRGAIMRDRKRDYELLFIVSPLRSSEEEIAATVEKVAQSIATVGGSVSSTQQTAPWGRRKFAYPMREYAEGEASRRVFNEGYYVLVTCSLPTLQIRELERVLKLNDSILRYMLTGIEARPAAPAAEAEAQA